MKKILKSGFVLLTILGFASMSSAYASYSSSTTYNYSNEIISSFSYGHIISGNQCKTCGTTTDIAAQGAYLRTITANIQAGGLVGIESTSGGDTSETLLTAVALGIYNLEPNFKQALFVQGGLGIYPVANDNAPGHSSKFGLFIGGGKRFPLWDRINYMPTLSLVKKGDLNLGFDIEFLNFSIMF